MAKKVENETLEQEGKLFGSCLLWFFWGLTLSFTTVLSVVLLVLLIGSTTLNAWLGWKLSGFEIAIITPEAEALEAPLPAPPDSVAEAPTNTPAAAAATPISPPTSAPTESALESQQSTVAAIATEVADSATPGSASAPEEIPAATPTNVPGAVAIGSPQPETDNSEPGHSSPSASADSDSPSSDNTPVAVAGETQEFAPPTTSSNTYELIPLDGERESRPGEKHGDLNLKLRDPQPIDVELALVDIPNAGSDPSAPKFSSVLEPNIVNAYTIHNWDWGCDCKGELLREDQLVLVGLKTAPGQPVFIPTKGEEIYQGKFYATVLYASEDSLTFVYSRRGNVIEGYTVHYLGLHTDPNLLALYRESQGNELPGLTLDTPVGTATAELIVAIRDNGTFMDVRSRKDWWD